MKKILYLVIPCYNEAGVLLSSKAKLEDKLIRLIDKKLISNSSKIIFVDDGSRDGSWEIIESICKESSYCEGVRLSTNNGQQIALLEGIRYSVGRSDMVITIDCDLQDDIEVIDEMIHKYEEGNDIVYGVHSCRKKDSLFKRSGAYWFYKLLPLLNINLPANHSEYRLMSRSVMEDIVRCGRRWLPIRCFVSKLSYPSCEVHYSRQVRQSGKTRYSVLALMALAWHIIIGFSVRPVYWMMGVGVALTGLGCLGGISVGILDLGVDYRVALLLSSVIAGATGVVVFCLGVVGCYLVKVLECVREQPVSYEVSSTTDKSSGKIKLLNNIF